MEAEILRDAESWISRANSDAEVETKITARDVAFYAAPVAAAAGGLYFARPAFLTDKDPRTGRRVLNVRRLAVWSVLVGLALHGGYYYYQKRRT